MKNEQAGYSANMTVLPWLGKQAMMLGMALASFTGPVAAQTLEGQNKGDTNTWYSGNLAGWAELDYIPMRVSFAAGSAGSHSVTLNFPHFSGKIFGFENLSQFAAFTPNLQFTSPATLVTDASGNWSYVFAVNVSDNNPAEVRFFARLASGAHLYGGSSLQLKGSAGILQFHKPLATAGAPNLGLTISGPAQVLEGGNISYTLTYTNQAPLDGATGVQITQLLDPSILVDPAGLPTNASIIGNTLFWDLGNVSPLTGGKIQFTGLVAPGTIAGTSLVDQAQIFSAQDDSNMSDNSAQFTTTVVCGGAGPNILANPQSAMVCPGDPVLFSVTVAAPATATYQWSKDGVLLAGATASSLAIASASATDLGSYSAVVSSPCGTAVSAAAMLSFATQQPILITSYSRRADGSFVLTFPTACGGTYTVQYTEDFIHWSASPVTVTGNGAVAEWVEASQAAQAVTTPLQAIGRCFRVVRSQ